MGSLCTDLSRTSPYGVPQRIQITSATILLCWPYNKEAVTPTSSYDSLLVAESRMGDLAQNALACIRIHLFFTGIEDVY